MRLRSILVGILTSFAVLGAEVPEYSLVAYYYTGLKEVRLEELQFRAEALGFETEEAILGFQLDLNGDGRPDHLLRGSCSATGSCSVRVIDGMTKSHIATLSGRPLIVHSARINNWPVLSIYHHLGAADGSLTTYVYDGQRYHQISSVTLHEQGVSDLFKKLESIPSIGKVPDVVHTAPNSALQRAGDT